MRRLILTGVIGGLLVILGAPAAMAESKLRKGETAVSFTFDGGYKGQDVAAKILADRGMAGTFYLNSGYLGFPAYLTVDQVRTIARQRHEIGGASTLNNDLSKLPAPAVRSQVCDDRATLDRLGFQVTSFAYPSGAETPDVRRIVGSCGYNSGRDVSGLYNDPKDCSSCPAGETIPPTNDWRVRTSQVSTVLPTLVQRVLRAENSGGGWVPLVFRHICVCPDKGDQAITPTNFANFVRWVENRPATTTVHAVDQLVGGAFKPVQGQPLARLVPALTASPSNNQRPFSQSPAWTLFGIGIGQSQIIAVGLLLAITVVLTYRSASRGNRYGNTHQP